MTQWTSGSKIDNYILEEMVGTFKGFAIWTAINAITKQKVTIRIFPRAVLKSEFHKNLFASEKIVLKSINSPFIPQLFEIIETPAESFIVKEYIPYNPISKVVKESGPVPYIIAKKYFQEFVIAVNHLHDHDFVIFDDFTTESVLVDENDHIRIVDYEFFKEGSLPPYHINNKPESLPLSGLNFIPPEVLAGDIPSKKADTWCAGIFLYYIVVGDLPFKSTEQIYSACPEFPQKIPQKLQDLINQMLRKDPMQRVSLRDVLSNNWLSKNELQNYCETFALRNNYINAVDPFILNKMEQFGLNVEYLPQMLMRDEDMYLTSIYRQFHRQNAIMCASAEIDSILSKSTSNDDIEVCKKSRSKPNLPIMRRCKHANIGIFLRHQSFKP